MDRQKIIKRLNEKAYSAPNLFFECDDVFDVIAAESDEVASGVLFHSRTGVLCYPEMLKNLYRQAAAHGIEYVVLFEPIGLSRESLHYYEEAEIPGSIAFRSVMFIHNYSQLLAEAGYEVLETKRLLGSMFLYDDPGGCMSFLVARRI